MSKRPDGNMVLRSVYLPEEMDNRLRAVAYLHTRSKGDLIRELVQMGLKRLEEETILASQAEPAIRSALERTLESADVQGVDVTAVARQVAAAVVADLEIADTEKELARSVEHAA